MWDVFDSNIMQSIGLNAVPTWLKPYFILSQGEQYRATFARLLSEALKHHNGYIMMDEFSSVLDRKNAVCMSVCIARFIRRNSMDKIANFILSSANNDIVRYLQPDLLISLGPNNEMKLIPNPNDLNKLEKYQPDIKVVLDLPPLDDPDMKYDFDEETTTLLDHYRTLVGPYRTKDQCRINVGPILEQYKTNRGPISDQDRTNIGPT